jgi:endoglucanase
MLTYLFSKRAGKDAALVREVRDSLIAAADSLVRERNAHGYARPLGPRYYWGANGTVARQTVLLQGANRIAPKRAYVETALDALGHLFGRNVYGRSFVTGLGANPPLRPHDRRSGGDAVEAPWPGYLVGGGHPKATDWKDEEASYQTNETAINWNGALIYALAGFVTPKAAASPPR